MPADMYHPTFTCRYRKSIWSFCERVDQRTSATRYPLHVSIIDTDVAEDNIYNCVLNVNTFLVFYSCTETDHLKRLDQRIELLITSIR